VLSKSVNFHVLGTDGGSPQKIVKVSPVREKSVPDLSENKTGIRNGRSGTTVELNSTLTFINEFWWVKRNTGKSHPLQRSIIKCNAPPLLKYNGKRGKMIIPRTEIAVAGC